MYMLSRQEMYKKINNHYSVYTVIICSRSQQLVILAKHRVDWKQGETAKKHREASLINLSRKI